jgi:hypothetical protein
MLQHHGDLYVPQVSTALAAKEKQHEVSLARHTTACADAEEAHELKVTYNNVAYQ